MAESTSSSAGSGPDAHPHGDAAARPAVGGPGLDELRGRVARIRWFHSIELAPGVITPGVDATRDRLDHLRIPPDLSGRSVLDIGAWDGFFSFEAERRGASRVLAADSFAWDGSNWSTKAGFELARAALGSRVEDLDRDVMALAPEEVGTFDLVLLLGVLYHLRHPLAALERVASVTARQLILETHVDALFTRRPAMVMYPGQELENDPTNWWGPNPEAVVGMLHAAGFRRVEVVSRDSWAYRLARAARRTPGHLRGRIASGGARQGVTQGRAVFHAFR